MQDLLEPALRGVRYFAWLYAYGAQRALLAALFGIEREIRQSLRPGLDHQVAHTRLQWWREELARCAQGRPVHPLTVALLGITGSTQPLSGLSGFVDTCLWDLANASFESRRELIAYAQRWAAAIQGPVAAVEAAQAWQWNVAELGATLCELEFLDTLLPQARAGRIRVPLDELDRIGARPEELLSPPWSAAIAKLLAARHETLRAQLLAVSGSLQPTGQLPMRGLLVWSGLAWRSSRRAQQRLPLAPRNGQRGGMADAWYAWRAARGASLGRFRLQ
ncbi:MAG TPA: squalene/phytoene synthase family protein [Steroidobacteraceae bacterium]